jgi:putative endonuclease
MPNSPTRPLGQRGEKLASEYLQARGYEIVTANWRCQIGEIDLIARKDDVLVFVEVRTRHADTAEAGFESIVPRKQKKLAALAAAYLSLNNLETIASRVDVIAIAIPRSGAPIIEHAEDALGW